MLSLLPSPTTIESWVQGGGYAAIFAVLFFCGLGLPMPEDIPILVGGFFVGQGRLNLIPVAVACWCGVIGGDCVLYFLGRKFGMGITRVPLIGRHVTPARITKAELLFERYGVWVIAIGRMLAGIRGGVVVAAGAIRYNFLTFLIVDGLAAIVSGGLFLVIGIYAGKHAPDLSDPGVQQKIKEVKHWLIAGIVVAICLFTVYVIWRRRKHTTITDVALTRAAEKAVGSSVDSHKQP